MKGRGNSTRSGREVFDNCASIANVSANASVKKLVVQGDDFGMCHAVNRGILQSFQSGVLTQASMMAPCPWISEATRLAKQHEIPIGVHATLTCEWDHLRWRPLTTGRSLSESDGTMHRTLDDAIARIDATEAADELAAQIETLSSEGLRPSYLDCHMGPTSRAAFEATCRRFDLPFIYPLIDPCVAFDSIAMMSPLPANEKKGWLLNRLEEMPPGLHLIVTHPGVDDPELRNIARPDSENFDWAEPNRTSDLAVLLDDDVASAIRRFEVELVSVASQ